MRLSSLWKFLAGAGASGVNPTRAPNPAQDARGVWGQWLRPTGKWRAHSHGFQDPWSWSIESPGYFIGESRGETYAVRNESKIVQYLAIQKDRKIVSQYFKCWFCLLYFGVSVTVCEEKKTGLGCQPLESTSASRPPLPSNPGHGPCQQTLPLSRAVWQILGKNPLDWWCDVFSLARRWSSSLAFADRCGLNGPAPQPSAVSLIPKVQIPRGETHLWPMRRKACLGGHIFLGEAFAMYNWRERELEGCQMYHFFPSETFQARQAVCFNFLAFSALARARCR